MTYVLVVVACLVSTYVAEEPHYGYSFCTLATATHARFATLEECEAEIRASAEVIPENLRAFPMCVPRGLRDFDAY